MELEEALLPKEQCGKQYQKNKKMNACQQQTPATNGTSLPLR
jgi:hypothetical protein